MKQKQRANVTQNGENQPIVISEKLKIFRAKHRLSQAELGKRLFVSPQAISKWERGVCYPDITLLPRLAALLGCSVNDFFGGTKQ